MIRSYLDVLLKKDEIFLDPSACFSRSLALLLLLDVDSA